MRAFHAAMLLQNGVLAEGSLGVAGASVTNRRASRAPDWPVTTAVSNQRAGLSLDHHAPQAVCSR